MDSKLTAVCAVLVFALLLAGCERWWAHNMSFGVPGTEIREPAARSPSNAEIMALVDQIAAKHGFSRVGNCGEGAEYIGRLRECRWFGCSERVVEMWAAPSLSGLNVRLFEFIAPEMDAPPQVLRLESELEQAMESRFRGSVLARWRDGQLGSAGVCGTAVDRPR